MPFLYFCAKTITIMKKLLAIMALLGAHQAHAQYTNIKIYEGKGGGIGPCEPSIAINPANPAQLVAGAVLNDVCHSLDSGRTWQCTKLTSDYGVWGDPCIVADKKGQFHYFHLSDPTGRNWKSPEILDRIVAQTSADGGKTWTGGSSIGLNFDKDQDKEWAVADLKNNNLYITWTEFDRYNSKEPGDSTRILFSRSSDGGKSWNTPVRINQFSGNCLDDDMTVEGAVPAVGANGEIFVAWSFDDKIYFDRSENGGRTWQEQDVVIAQQPKGWSIEVPGAGRANGFPVTTADVSESKYKGTVYVNWSDQRNGTDDTDIWIAKSKDGGRTWSQPKRVNDDGKGKHQFFNWMAVDPATGYVYVVFYDRRAYSDNQTDVYLAYSKDGGDTFTNVKISESPFTPTDGIFFGDYNNISVYNGMIRPIWTRYENGKLSIWTALIDASKLK
jgi:Neuraminidase (sialidase)